MFRGLFRLAGDGEDVVVDINSDVLFLEARKLEGGRNSIVFVVFVDVQPAKRLLATSA